MRHRKTVRPMARALCRWLRDQATSKNIDLEITVGGGVRNGDDLDSLAKCGVDAVLVASALHDGRITAEEIQRWR